MDDLRKEQEPGKYNSQGNNDEATFPGNNQWWPFFFPPAVPHRWGCKQHLTISQVNQPRGKTFWKNQKLNSIGCWGFSGIHKIKNPGLFSFTMEFASELRHGLLDGGARLARHLSSSFFRRRRFSHLQSLQICTVANSLVAVEHRHLR